MVLRKTPYPAEALDIEEEDDSCDLDYDECYDDILYTSNPDLSSTDQAGLKSSIFILEYDIYAPTQKLDKDRVRLFTSNTSKHQFVVKASEGSKGSYWKDAWLEHQFFKTVYPESKAYFVSLDIDSFRTILPYVSGDTLNTFITSDTSREIWLKIFIAAAHALNVLHSRRVVHGDIKGNNVVLTMQDNGDIQASYIDFGVASKIDTPVVVYDHDDAKKYKYIAPERFYTKRKSTLKLMTAVNQDIYSFARMIENPWVVEGSYNNSLLMRECREIEMWVLRAISPNPLERPSLDEFIEIAEKELVRLTGEKQLSPTC